MTTPQWLRDEALDPLGQALAAHAWRAHERRLDDATREDFARIVLLLAAERSRGHGAVHPDDWAGAPAHPDLPIGAMPSADAWSRAVDAAAWVGDGSDPTPLVLRPDGSLALYRDDVAEIELAARLRAMVTDVRDTPPDARTVAAFRRLFDPSEASGAALAGAAALRARLTVITGGPGTGKTTTVVRVLGLLLSEDPSRRVAVAAPTGKAAARLQESLREERDGLPVDDAVKAALPTSVGTVHRLLRYRPHDGSFGHDARRPLPHDVVVVDEASMLDLGLARALITALSPRARLVLLGDRDQLASVDAGAVLEDLVAARTTDGDARSSGFAAFTNALFDADVGIDDGADAFADATVELRKNWRFGSQPAIANLAAALRAGDAAGVLAVLDETPPAGGVHRVPAPAHAEDLAPTIDAWLDRVDDPRTGDDAERLRAVESSLRLLAALRQGPWGVEGLNAAVEARLRRRGWPVDDPWYEGRPVMILRNVQALDLANGDVGVCAPGETPAVVLGTRDGGTRRLGVSALPPHETAWAMTVHKAQGSEFDHVLMVLPPEGHPLATRSLLYTGVTRARRTVTVVGTPAAVTAAVEARSMRRTALASRLRIG